MPRLTKYLSPAKPCPVGKDRAPGFALVIALVLMGLLVLLILSLAALVRTEVEVGSSEALRTQARQNALFALQEALGQLQEAAGADQRVTARADIEAGFDGLNDDAMTFASVANPYYTLVWDVSGAENQEPGSVPGHDASRKPYVLVSGNSQLNFNPLADADYPQGYVTGATVLNAADEDVITLADYHGTSAGENFQVRVPRVQLEEQGYYAWWVGDENVKARLNLDAPIDTARHADAAWLSPQHFSPQLNPTLAAATAQELARVESVGDLGLGILSAEQMKSGGRVLMRDYSTVSRSLLTDVRNGGIKKDLSFGLDNGNTAPALITDDTYLFARDLGGAPADLVYNLNFVQWGVLRDYYNARVQSQPVAATASRVASAASGANFSVGVRPVVTLFQLGVYADYVDQKIRFLYFPAIVLWNPYNFDISIPELHLRFKESRGNNKIEISKIEVEGDSAVTNETFDVMGMPFTLTSATIPAGKAVIFSPAAGIHPYSEGSNLGIYLDPAQRNYLSPGFRQGAGFEQITDLELSALPDPLAVPRLRFALQPNGNMHIDLHSSVAGGSADLNRIYHIITGVRSDTAVGTSNLVQFYEPLPAGSFPEPKFLFIYGMPFAQSSFLSSNTGARQWAGMFNPRAIFNTDDTVGFGYNGLDNYVGGFLVDSEAEANASIQTPNGVNAYVGTSAAFGGSEQAILFDLPRAPLHSLAQLAHANVSAPPSSRNKEGSSLLYRPGRDGWGATALQALRVAFSGSGDDSAPAYVVGNSHASPYIPLDGSGSDVQPYWRIFDRDAENISKMVWDFSYLTNEVLFDRYFFSTLPQTGSVTLPLRNPLMGLAPGVDASDANLRHFDRAGAGLMINGGFNANSTSVEAWSAFLAAFRDKAYDDKSGSGSLFARFFEPAGDLIAANDVGPWDEASMTGFRRLSDAQVRDLAERIVEQVRLRGPFPSMAAFVNRVMYPQGLYRQDLDGKAAPDPHSLYGSGYDLEEMVMRQGALSAALELSSANEAHYDSGNVVSTSSLSSGSTAEKRGFVGAIGKDVPGYLSQVDILSVLGPLLTVRSDTFIIRVYGAAAAPGSSQVGAQVYGEAVVQRLPEYISTADNAWDTPAEDVNKNLGRRFRVTSFRWLAPEELSN